MQYVDNVNINEVENYLNTIFDLQKKVVDKDFKITMLEFELALEKQLLNSFKKYFSNRCVGVN